MRNTVKCVHSRCNCSTQFLASSLGFRFVGLQTGPSFYVWQPLIVVVAEMKHSVGVMTDYIISRT